jgi:predicted peptidase
MPTVNHFFNTNSIKIGYKLFLPKEYNNQNLEPFPLIMFLHGIKKRGNDLSLLEGYGLIHIAEQDADFRYIVVAPQCPSDTYWSENRTYLLELLDEVIRDYSVDQRRIYLTGFSMGGHGAWDLAAKTKDIFAAAAPIAGWYETGEAVNLTSIPIWAFHGEEDDVVPISSSESMINAIMDIGGKPRFTRYPELDHRHIVMFETYTNPELYAWFESNKKKI